ncbi:MAG: hypothetical protein O2820_10025 [Planctomycetota bacterium]|nr:hypothetical protein [Planctomycetota bacterium]MDA1249550.1 hypothetical protein [Planctomycetota bacterium]
MQFPLWSRSAILIAMISLSVPANHAVAYGDDPRLLKRNAELEAENRALRKILGGIQDALKSVPKSSVQEAADSQSLRIVVVPGEWGGSELADIKKVCASAAGTILAQLPDDGFAPILVERGKGSPITLFRRGEGNEYIVRLNTSDRAWAQCAFQFAHEFGHIVCNYREVENPQLWFEESLCECASLFALRRMAVEWRTNPPYSNWKSYSTSLTDYASNRIAQFEERKESTAEFYKQHQKELEKTATNRDLNGFVALKLLPLFEKTPGAWQSLRYLNLGDPKENKAFADYLSGWHDRVPAEHKAFVRSVAAEFEFDLLKK